MKPTAANQLKRGGFLEVRPKQSRRRVGLNLQSAPICKFSAQLPVQRFAITERRTAVFNGQSALANLPHHATHG